MPDTVSAALPLDVNDGRKTAVVSLSGEAILESICCEERLP
ncbi:MAG: hypothetical protein QXI96_02190 [Thermofilum sp.]